jgi:hypothetical protein
MNGTLSANIRRKLMPALEHSQGYRGTYSRSGSNRPLIVIPVNPEWVNEDDHAVIEEWAGSDFLVSIAEWQSTGFGTPQESDRLAVTLADGIPRNYALLPPENRQAYELAAAGTHYLLHMKWVSQ